jgi:hypothetical protein
MREDSAPDVLGRPDHGAVLAKAAREGCRKAPEQMDMLRFLSCELQKRADAVVVAIQQRAGMIEHEGKDELLHQPEQGQIFVPLYLVEHQALA